MGPLQGVVINLALGYVAGAIKDYGATVNWAQQKAHAIAWLQQTFKWHWLEAKLEVLVVGVMDAAADVLSDDASVKSALAAVANKDWAGEVSVVKGLLAKEWKPESAEGQQVLAYLQAA